MAILKTSLLALLASVAAEGPEYPLGKLRIPPMAEPADPFRLVDLRYAFSDDGGTVSSFQTRIRVGAGAFLGGEVTGDRHGLSFDTQRIELGVSEENGRYDVEGSIRAPWFVLGAAGSRTTSRDWLVDGTASVRLSNDLEILFSYAEDLDATQFRPGTVGDFAESGQLPEPAPPTREVASKSAGFLYQKESYLEVGGEARRSKLRTEGAFDLDVEHYRFDALLNRSPVELRGSTAFDRTYGRLSHDEGAASLAADVEIGRHLLARGDMLQRWEPGVLRFEERYRAGLTFFGRRHRFSRSSEAAARILALQRKANELGYNERRVYDVEGLRRFREHLGISHARGALAEELDALYRAEVRDRNVPQLGFTLGLHEDAVLGIDSLSYRILVGVPWKVRWPFSRSEVSVEFLSAELGVRRDDYPGGVRAVSYEALLSIFLNREMSLRIVWERPGITPEEIARQASRPARITVSYDYALGR